MNAALEVFVHTERWPWLVAAILMSAAGAALWARRRERRRRALGARWVQEEGAASRGDIALPAIGFLALAVALLDPRWGPGESANRPDTDVVVCLDVSRSMFARDVLPSRLEWTQQTLTALSSDVRGERLALVAFAGDARLVAPLTEDMATFREIVADVGPLSVTRGGTDVAAALDVAARAASAAQGAVSIVLISDGESHLGDVRGVVDDLRARDVPVHTVALGSARGAKIPIMAGRDEIFLVDADGRDVVTRPDVDALAAIASATGGEALHVDSADDVVSLNSLVHEAARGRSADHSDDPRTRRPRYAWLVALACCAWLIAWDRRLR